MALRNLAPWRRRGEASLANPFEAMRGLVEPMERLFEPFWSASSRLEPRFDVEETPQELIVSAALPGYARDDISVDITENTLTVRGRRSKSEESRRHGALKKRSEEQSFVRRMALPAAVKTGETKASFKGDKLEIRLPRVKEAEVRRVTVD